MLVWLEAKTSQMLGPLPSVAFAPSICISHEREAGQELCSSQP